MGGRKYGVSVRRTPQLRLPKHPDAPTQGEWPTWMKDSPRPIAVDLFSGAGGLSLGLEAAGYQVALSVDLDEWALETHAANFAGLALRLDLGSDELRDGIVRLFEGVEVDLVAGGPPCQPFSRAGRSKIRSLVDLGLRESLDGRKELWRAFLDVVERIRPRAVLMENVPDMALGDDMVTLRVMVERLEQAGYEVDARIVDAWLHGVPQHRQRLILVGLRDGATFEWPECSDRVTVREAIFDLPVLEVEPDRAVGERTMPYGDRHMSDFARAARKDCIGDEASVVHDHVTRAVREDDYRAFQLMTSETLYSDLPESVKRYRDDIFDDKYNRLDWDDYSRSITAHIAKDGYWYIHPDQHRTLTVREAARIQTFPDSFRFAGSRSHQFQQIGNAVPPALGEAIGVAVLAAVRANCTGARRRSVTRNTFRERLLAWAASDADEAPWAYPGRPWPAAVGLLLGGRGGGDWPDPAYILGLIPRVEDANPRLLAAVAAMTDPGSRADRVRRLSKIARAVRTHPEGWASEGWRKQGKLGPAGRAWFDVLTGESVGLVPSTAVTRVAARVTGTSETKNRLSAGRIELAKLVGASESASTLNAAMHRLGQLICTPEGPDCHICPVRDVCEGATC